MQNNTNSGSDNQATPTTPATEELSFWSTISEKTDANSRSSFDSDDFGMISATAQYFKRSVQLLQVVRVAYIAPAKADAKNLASGLETYNDTVWETVMGDGDANKRIEKSIMILADASTSSLFPTDEEKAIKKAIKQAKMDAIKSARHGFDLSTIK